MTSESRAAIGVHHTDTTGEAWDGPANQARLRNDESAEYYRSAYAWKDPEGDPKTKAAYKFIHHEVAEGGDIGAANLTACSTGIGVLNGGRGGTTIPDGDRPGVHAHLGAHLEDAGKDVPELKARWQDGVERRYGQIERRTISATDLRISSRAGQPQRIQGYGAVFNSWSDELGWFREMIKSGTFTRCLESEPDVRCLWQHDSSYVFGRTVAGTLELNQDERGLFYDCLPPETTWARDALETIRRGDVTQSSFAFMVPKGGDRWVEEDGVISRTIHDADLFDVSPVTFPAYPDTVVGVRTLMEAAGQDPRRMLAMLAQVKGAPGIAVPRDGWNQALAAMMGLPEEPQDEEEAAAVEMMRRRMELAERAV